MIISLHIPKTAGSSFGKALAEAYVNRIKFDYNYRKLFKKLHEKGKSIDEIRTEWLQYPKNKSIIQYFCSNSLSNEIEVIHGHFPANKYFAHFKFKKAIYITWVRDPFTRMVSNYFFWRSVKDKNGKLWNEKILQKNQTLEKFCFDDTMKNYQSQFFTNFNVKDFAFIGIVENYQDELKFLSKNVLHKKLSVYHENKTESSDLKNALQDEDLRKKFTKFHDKDYELYKYALTKKRDREKFLL